MTYDLICTEMYYLFKLINRLRHQSRPTRPQHGWVWSVYRSYMYSAITNLCCVITYADDSPGSKAFIRVCLCLCVCVYFVRMMKRKTKNYNNQTCHILSPPYSFNIRSKGQSHSVTKCKTILKAIEWLACSACVMHSIECPASSSVLIYANCLMFSLGNLIYVEQLWFRMLDLFIFCLAILARSIGLSYTV